MYHVDQVAKAFDRMAQGQVPFATSRSSAVLAAVREWVHGPR
jgi:hypothetical protein